MVNSEDFIKKLEILLDYYSLNASAFADKIGVQRSSLSHLLSGRNKPSLDFIMKIVESFPEVDLYWFLMNIGTFPKDEKKKVLVEKHSHPIVEKLVENENEFDNKSSNNDASQSPRIPKNEVSISTDSDIEKIVVFFVDGTFKNYQPK